MHGDSQWDRVLLWVADRVPDRWSQRLHWRVQDHRLDRAMARRERAHHALRKIHRRDR
jgi:hypothetical protein